MQFLFLTSSSEEIVYAALWKRGLSSQKVRVKKVDYDNVPFELCRSKVGIAFYNTDYSVAGCAPTKVGEYLACGLPVVVNAGIGDLDGIIKKENLRTRCRIVAKKYFSLRNRME